MCTELIIPITTASPSMEFPLKLPIGLQACILTLLVLSLVSCTSQPEIAARVGEVIITTEDITYRQEVTTVRSGEPSPAHLVLLQLLEEALMAEVGRAHGVVVSDDMLAAEAIRVQQTSRDPESLSVIRAVFGDDEDSYRRLLLQPILVNQLLHARFSLGHDIQAEPLARAYELLAAAQVDSASLAALAESYGGEYRQMKVRNGRLLSDEQPDKDQISVDFADYNLEWPDYDRQFAEQVLEGLETGQLHPKVVEDRHNFMVVRLLSRDGQDALLESVVIPKLSFDPWFQTQSLRIPLVIHDPELKTALLASVDLPYLIDRISNK
jgi:hypothetical protein